MAMNPMQRKANNSFLLGILITLVITGLIIGFLIYQVSNLNKKLEEKLLPDEIDYSKIKGLRIEARQKLNKIKPNSVGQASRISGVSPADVSVLLITLQQLKNKEK